MNQKVVTISLPTHNDRKKIDTRGFIKTITSAKKANPTIYDFVELLTKENVSQSERINQYKIGKIKMKDIINLHNCQGIKDILSIKRMINQIKSGCHLVQNNNFPNIKLVRCKDSSLILFDGHHSMLAYMAQGFSYLYEIPYIFITNQNDYVEEEEILVFFGKCAEKLKSTNWRNYVINWQNPDNQHLEQRIQKNMGDLYNSISHLIKLNNS